MKITPTSFYPITPINKPPKPTSKAFNINTTAIKISAKAKLLAQEDQELDCAKTLRIKGQINAKTYVVDNQKIAAKMLLSLI